MSILAGQERQQRVMVDAMTSGRMPHAWLLTGPKGVGKAGFARLAALYLLAGGQAGAKGLAVSDNHPAAKLVAAGAHPEFLLIEREQAKSANAGATVALARNITIEQIRNLMGKLRVRPGVAEHRAVIIDSIDDLERGAANALLKTIEEPPDKTIFFLVSHNPGRLLPTIRSRCRALPFPPLDDDAVARVLSDRLPATEKAVLAALTAISRGSPGRALALAEQASADVASQLGTIAESGDRDNAGKAKLAKLVGSAAERQRFECMLTQAESIAAHRAVSARLDELGQALDVRDAILHAARFAVAASEDPGSVSIVVANALAATAKR